MLETNTPVLIVGKDHGFKGIMCRVVRSAYYDAEVFLLAHHLKVMLWAYPSELIPQTEEEYKQWCIAWELTH